MNETTYKGLKFTDADVVNPDDFIPAGESNPHNVRPWLLHDNEVVIAVCFADCLGDALDAAADAGKLNRYLVNEADEEADDGHLSYLGNYCKAYDIGGLNMMELPNPPFSFVAMFDANIKGLADLKPN